MKTKSLFTLALSLFAAGALFADEAAKESKFSGSVCLDFESQYVFRGHGLANTSFQPCVSGEYQLPKGSLYGYVWNETPIGDDANEFLNEIDYSLGYEYPVTDKLSILVGDILYTYLDNTHGATNNRNNEIYLGVTYDGLLVCPSAYVYYDFNYETITAEAFAKYSFDLEKKLGLKKTSLDLNVNVGGTSSTDVDSDQIAGKPHNGYAYYAASADLTYHFTEDNSASVGIRYAGNNDNTDTGSGVYDRENNLWWGAKLTVAF